MELELTDFDLPQAIDNALMLDGEVGGLGPSQDLVHEVGGTPKHVRCVWRVGHEATFLDILR